MSIRALHYITGDTQKAGFKRIGGSDSFPADRLPYLNNKEVLPEQARVIPSGGRQSGNGIQLLSWVWEYQTGKYGCPVIIQTMAAISTGRAHSFSEYVMGDTNEIADVAEPWQVIKAAEKASPMLELEKFMALSGKETIDSPEESWEPESEETAPTYHHSLDADWRLTLLSNYWKQASIRAFSEDAPAAVRVYFGELGDNPSEEIRNTIREAKLFFSDVIARGLPRQVQNIASMSAGVNGGDQNSLFSALEFDLSQNRDGESSFIVSRQRFPRILRLNEAEKDFILAASEGRIPESAKTLFEKYQKLADPDATVTNTPFMADYRVLYGLYCLEQIAREKHDFIEKAKLDNEYGSDKKARDARACFLLMKNIRSWLEKDHRLNDLRRGLVTELLEPLETPVYQIMLKDMESSDAEPFMIRRNDMMEFHRKTLYSASEEQIQVMIDLAVKDQQVAKAPQFVRCYPEIPIRTEEADLRNSRVLEKLLQKVIYPLIENEKSNEKITNKYLNELRSDTFKQWIQGRPDTKITREVFLTFLREEIKDAQKHFLLYGITREYLPIEELLQISFAHLSANNANPDHFPTERQIQVTRDGFSKSERNTADSIDAMNRYYLACFREYRGGIEAIRQHGDTDLIEAIGRDASGAMVMIFSEVGKTERISPEEARAIFNTFGENTKKTAIFPVVIRTYTEMLNEQRDLALNSPKEEDREEIVDWLSQMIKAAPFPIDTTDSIQAILKSATTGIRMKRVSVEKILNGLLPHAMQGKDQIRQAFTAMVQSQFETALASKEQDVLDWVSGMIAVSGEDFALDTTDILKEVFEAGKSGKRLSPQEVGVAFDTMKDNAEGLDTKVRRAYDDMLKVRREEAAEKQDKDAFQWLCDMTNKAPWKDPEWVSEQHSSNLAFLCDLQESRGEEIDPTSLSMIRGWLEEETVTSSGRERLQRFCNYELKKDKTQPAELFSSFFININEDCHELREYLFAKAKDKFIQLLQGKNMTFGSMVSVAGGQAEQAGYKLNDLYEQVKEPVNQYLTDYFSKNTEIAPLIRELNEIPPENRFHDEWKKRLSEQMNSQQIALFNSQPNLERVIALREDIESYSNQMVPSLRAAYQLIELTDERFAALKKSDEIDAIEIASEAANEFSSRMSSVTEVHKSCAALFLKSFHLGKRCSGSVSGMTSVLKS